MFCFFYALSSDGKESAIKSGYEEKKAEQISARLLMRSDIRKEANTLREELFSGDEKSLAKLGLCKIAFGNPKEVAQIALKIKNGEEEISLRDTDLFCVSEIKLSKNDCFEIKLFDKIKALEALSKLGEEKADEEKRDLSFFEALYKGKSGDCLDD